MRCRWPTRTCWSMPPFLPAPTTARARRSTGPSSGSRSGLEQRPVVARSSHTGPRQQRPKPTDETHLQLELGGQAGQARLILIGGKVTTEHSLSYARSEERRVGKESRTLDSSNALPLADQNVLVNAAIPAGAHNGTRAAINRAEQRQPERTGAEACGRPLLPHRSPAATPPTDR